MSDTAGWIEYHVGPLDLQAKEIVTRFRNEETTRFPVEGSDWAAKLADSVRAIVPDDVTVSILPDDRFPQIVLAED